MKTHPTPMLVTLALALLASACGSPPDAAQDNIASLAPDYCAANETCNYGSREDQCEATFRAEHASKPCSSADLEACRQAITASTCGQLTEQLTRDACAECIE